MREGPVEGERLGTEDRAVACGHPAHPLGVAAHRLRGILALAQKALAGEPAGLGNLDGLGDEALGDRAKLAVEGLGLRVAALQALAVEAGSDPQAPSESIEYSPGIGPSLSMSTEM